MTEIIIWPHAALKKIFGLDSSTISSILRYCAYEYKMSEESAQIYEFAEIIDEKNDKKIFQSPPP